MKKYTIILFSNKKYRVCSTNNIDNFLFDKKKRYNDLEIFSIFNGDYREKIRHFGIARYLRAIQNTDKWLTLDAQLKYNR